MKKTLIILLFLGIKTAVYSQNTTLDKYKGAFTLDLQATLGKNNYGPGLMIGYFIDNDHQIRLGAKYKKFEFKDYQETILEGNLDYGYTFWAPPRFDRLFRNFAFTAIAGVATEMVQVKSETFLIDPYPQYHYGYFGMNIEFGITKNLTINIEPKQYIALNGSKEKLGQYRYDLSFFLRYYLY